MFKAAPNPYDEIVAKATDENQTSENWEVIISLCDKVTDEGENGARSVVAAILKRLSHRTSNVQLYSLSLAEALSKNCTIELHRELASRSFTQGLEKLVTDRNTHERVKSRALSLIKQWADAFDADPTLGIMNECYQNLRAKNYKFAEDNEAAPPEVDDDMRRREEEELQRVLELSMVDKGGRSHWVSDYPSSSGAGGSGAASSSGGGQSTSASAPAPGVSTSENSVPPVLSQNLHSSGYAPKANPASANVGAAHKNGEQIVSSPSKSPTSHSSQPPVSNAASSVPPATEAKTPAPTTPTPASRVRALHRFDATEPGELGFDKGDVIKVVDRGYKDWWRGQLRGKTGIFPVNYVEAIPEPTQEEIVREAQSEASIFAQAAAIDQLLEMLKKVDPVTDNIADNEELQELFRSSMTLRPKIVKLIERYNQKKADLVAMNDSFMRARKQYDSVMEESLAKWNPSATLNEYRPMTRIDADQPSHGPVHLPNSHFQGVPYGWNPALIHSPAAPSHPGSPVHFTQQSYLAGGQPHHSQSSMGQPQYGQAYTPRPEQNSQHVPPHSQAFAVDNGLQHIHHGVPATTSQPPLQALRGAQPPNAKETVQVVPDPHLREYPGQSAIPPNYSSAPGSEPIHSSNTASGFTNQGPSGGQSPLHRASSENPGTLAPNPVTVSGAEVQHSSNQRSSSSKGDVSSAQMNAPSASPPQFSGPEPRLSLISGPPPYPFDPRRGYEDANAQAWAQYYAGGGADPAGKVYFIPSTLPASAHGIVGGKANPALSTNEAQTATAAVTPADQRLSHSASGARAEWNDKQSSNLTPSGVTATSHSTLPGVSTSIDETALSSPHSFQDSESRDSGGVNVAGRMQHHQLAHLSGGQPYPQHIQEPSRRGNVDPNGGQGGLTDEQMNFALGRKSHADTYLS